MPVDYSLLPGHCRESVRAYIEEHRPVGDFLTAVFANDLTGALSRADRTNSLCLKDYMYFLCNEAPLSCWGSHKQVKAWIAKGEKEAKRVP